MIFLAYLTDYTLCLLIRAAKIARVGNYEDLCRHCFGKKGYIAVSLSMLLFDFGALLTYLIILGDSLLPVLNEFFNWNSIYYRRISIIISSIFLILPWLLYRDISKIEKTSAISVFTVFFIIIIIFIKYFQIQQDHHQDDYTPIEINYFGSDILTALGTVSFSFVCHDSSFLLYNTLSNPTNRRWSNLTHYSLFIAVAASLIFSIIGYLTFGNKVEPNILINYPQSDYLIICMRITYVITMALTYPISFYVVRHVLYSAAQNEKSYVSVQEASNTVHYGITIPLFLITVIITMFVDNLGLVMSLTGSLAAVIIAFVLPSICYLKLSPYNILWWKNGNGNSLKAFLHISGPLFCCIFGILASICSTYYTLMNQ